MRRAEDGDACMTSTLTRRSFAGLARRAALRRHRAGRGGLGAIEAEAKGQTVYFNAWAGSPQINAYIAWAGDELKARHGITLEHVKLTDTAEAVRRVRDEVKAGKPRAAPTSSGSMARTSAS